MNIVSESLLTTDAYNKPTVLKDKDAVAILLLRLLISKPGTDRLHPERGIDVVGRYRYCEESDIDSLNDEIKVQINTYLPQFNSSTIVASVVDGELSIQITVDDTVFKFGTSATLSENEISLISE